MFASDSEQQRDQEPRNKPRESRKIQETWNTKSMETRARYLIFLGKDFCSGRVLWT